jgi:hypothetical protein
MPRPALHRLFLADGAGTTLCYLACTRSSGAASGALDKDDDLWFVLLELRERFFGGDGADPARNQRERVALRSFVVRRWQGEGVRSASKPERDLLRGLPGVLHPRAPSAVLLRGTVAAQMLEERGRPLAAGHLRSALALLRLGGMSSATPRALSRQTAPRKRTRTPPAPKASGALGRSSGHEWVRRSRRVAGQSPPVSLPWPSARARRISRAGSAGPRCAAASRRPSEPAASAASAGSATSAARPESSPESSPATAASPSDSSVENASAPEPERSPPPGDPDETLADRPRKRRRTEGRGAEPPSARTRSRARSPPTAAGEAAGPGNGVSVGRASLWGVIARLSCGAPPCPATRLLALAKSAAAPAVSTIDASPCVPLATRP